MAQKFTKYHPDPEVPITPEHRDFLVQWGRWDSAKARGVRVQGEDSQDGAVGGSGDDPEAPVPTDPSSAVTEASTGSDVDEDAPYSEWSMDELKAELTERKLPVSGKKTELVARLEENDEANA